MIPNALLAPAASPVRMAAARQRGLDMQAAWLARADVTALAAVLAQFDAAPPATPEALAEAIAPWLANHGWLDAWLAEGAAAMRADPFTAFPFRPVQGRATHGLVLLESARANVTLTVIDAQGLPAAQERTALFTGSLAVVEVIRAGGLVVRTHRLAGGERLAGRAPQRRLADGERLRIDNGREAVTMVAADSDAVLLRITCRTGDETAHRSFDLASGLEVARAMADERVSRMLPLLPLARLAGRPARAAPVLAALTRDADPLLRWSAMREWLVAERAAAATRLVAMAADDSDAAVRAAATATLALLTPASARACPA